MLSVWAIWRVVVVIVDGDGDPATVWRHVVLCGVGVLGRAVAYSAATALAHLVAFHTIAEIRLALGGAWVRRPVGELQRRHSSTAKTLALDSCEKMELFIAHVIPETAAAVTVWISVTVWLFTVDWRMTVAAVALVPVAFATMLRAIRGNGHRMGRWLEARTAMEAAVLDLLTALPVIRVFNRTGAEHRRTTDTVRENARLQSEWGPPSSGGDPRSRVSWHPPSWSSPRWERGCCTPATSPSPGFCCSSSSDRPTRSHSSQSSNAWSRCRCSPPVRPP
nr:ABC transporter transmembrane domain-containing protein [Corynebacterium marambiense]